MRSNSSAATYHFRYHSPTPGPRAATAPCTPGTPGTPGISPIMSRAGNVINAQIPDVVPQVYDNLFDHFE